MHQGQILKGAEHVATEVNRGGIIQEVGFCHYRPDPELPLNA